MIRKLLHFFRCEWESRVIDDSIVPNENTRIWAKLLGYQLTLRTCKFCNKKQVRYV